MLTKAPTILSILLFFALFSTAATADKNEDAPGEFSDVSEPLFWAPRQDDGAARYYSPFFTQKLSGMNFSLGMSLRPDFTMDLYGPEGRSAEDMPQLDYMRPSQYLGDLVTPFDEALNSYMLAPRVFVFVIRFK